MPVLGIDFDNTIVCYDDLFHALAFERHLIPADLPRTKQSVRDYLRQVGQEPAWTELQGFAYGPDMHRATAFPGVLDFFARCRSKGLEVSIISHKTQFPIIGPRHDLHKAATNWLIANGLFDAEHVYFELTKTAKLERIAQTRCTDFIDDLPEFLAEPAFPAGVRKILFDPNGVSDGVRSWAELKEMLLD